MVIIYRSLGIFTAIFV